MSDSKNKAKYSVDNSARNAERQKKRVANNFGNKGKNPYAVNDEANRAWRRSQGDYTPVNKAASLEQAPDSKFARKLSRLEKNKILGISPLSAKEEEQAALSVQ